MKVEDGIVKRKHLSTTVTRINYEPGNGTHYDVVITWLPDGFASAKWIINVYGFGSLWLGNTVSLGAGYLKQKMPVLTDSDARELIRLLRYVLK